MGLRHLILVIWFRFLTLLALVSIFLPPDAQNPHVWGDVFVTFCAAWFWTASDYVPD